MLTSPDGLLTLGGDLIGSVFSTSSAGPNRDAAAAIFPLAAAGNLAAVQAFRSRASIQTLVAAQPWKDGLARLPQSLQDAAQTAVNAGQIRASWWELQPEQVAPTVAQYHVMAPSGAIQPVAPGVMLNSVTATAETWAQKLLDVFGLGPRNQAQLAATAGQAAGQQVAQTLVVVVVLVLVGVLVYKLLRK